MPLMDFLHFIKQRDVIRGHESVAFFSISGHPKKVVFLTIIPYTICLLRGGRFFEEKYAH